MAYVVLLNGGELDRFDTLEAAVVRANESRCLYPGAFIEIAIFRNGLRISTELSIPDPVDAVLSDWTAWIPTSDWTVCSGGKQTRFEQRTRSVLVEPANGGQVPGQLLEVRIVEQDCVDPPAPVDCVVSAWGPWEAITGWGACIADVQERTEQRARTVVTQPANGGTSCPVLVEQRIAQQACETPEPDVDCVLSAFGAWTPTSGWSACVNNSQSRTEQRTRTIVTLPSGNGAACGALVEQRTVTQACLSPVDCVLSAWSNWTATGNWGPCVNGIQTREEQRTRTVLTQPANGGAACGPLVETRTASQACQVANPASPDGTRMPPNASATDFNAAVWTMVGDQFHKDGEWRNGGTGDRGVIANSGQFYAHSGNGNWYRDTVDGWALFGPDDPYTGPELDPPETGVSTTGSMTSGSANLVVADRTGFAVGDWVIVEIGKEPGLGQRGTRGVGGNWPSDAMEFASLNAAIAVYGANPAGNVYIWISGNNEVYWGRSVGWIWLGDLNWAPVTQTGDYYAAYRTPRSLQAQIASITPGSGTTGTFALENGPTDGVAKVSVIDATVYRDEILEINASLAAGNLQLTAGDHIVGGAVHISNETSRILEGATSDRTATRIITPKGVPCAGIDIYNSPSTIIRNLTLQGNWRDHGFGHNYGDGPAPHYEHLRGTPAASDGGYSVSVGIRANPGSHNTQFNNVATIDLPLAHYSCSVANNVWATDCDAKYTDPLRQYMQWVYYWCDTTGGGGLRCTYSGNYMVPCFESFKSASVSFIECGGKNATVSFNGSHSWLLQDFNCIYEPNSLVQTPTGIGRFQPIVNVNNNINMPASFLTPGGHIDGCTLNQQGYVYGGNTSMACAIKVHPGNPNVVIEGVDNTCPDYVSGSDTQGAQGVDSQGPNLILRNSTFRGKAAWTPANNWEHKAVLYCQNHNLAQCVGLSLPNDPNSKFYF